MSNSDLEDWCTGLGQSSFASWFFVCFLLAGSFTSDLDTVQGDVPYSDTFIYSYSMAKSPGHETFSQVNFSYNEILTRGHILLMGLFSMVGAQRTVL